MNIWLIIVAGGIVTYSSRASFIALGDRVTLPAPVERALAYVAPAAFAAISIPLIIGDAGGFSVGDDLPRFAAAVVAGAAVWWKKSLPLSLISGMSTLWLLSWLL